MTGDAPLRGEVNREVPPARPGEFRPLDLRAFRIWPPVVLAPMAGVTNAAFRRLCREFGAGLYVSEMITARGLVEGQSKTRRLAAFPAEEWPRSLQLYGSDPLYLGEATRLLVGEGAVDHLDLNFGCPVRKVTAAGGGSAIPARPRLLARLVRAVVGAAGDVPVTMKVRLGIDEGILTFRDSGQVAREEGCVAIGLHARTAAQLYDGAARWEAISELKEAVGDLAVLGNGDLWECWDALRMMRQSGCDGVIVGRGCLGRPWLFRELADVFEGRLPPAPPCLGGVLEVLRTHARYLIELFGEDHGILELRKWCGWYLKGFPGAARLKDQLFRIRSLQQFEEIVAGVDPNLPFPREALRARRAKRSGRQKVALPQGYLDRRDDDTPPNLPRDPEARAAFERALQGG